MKKLPLLLTLSIAAAALPVGAQAKCPQKRVTDSTWAVMSQITNEDKINVIKKILESSGMNAEKKDLINAILSKIENGGQDLCEGSDPEQAAPDETQTPAEEAVPGEEPTEEIPPTQEPLEEKAEQIIPTQKPYEPTPAPTEKPYEPTPAPTGKPAVAPTEKPSAPVSDTSAAAMEKEVLRIVNEERAKYGLNSLTWADDLAAVARAHSADMIKRSFFSHTNPDGLSPFDRLRNAGITYRSAAENIAYGQRSAQEVMTAWMNSSGHRANILNASLKEIGIGAVKKSGGTIYWTQVFVSR